MTKETSKYKKEYISKVDEYLTTKKDEFYQLLKTNGEKSTTWENRVRVSLPSKEDFASFIGVDDDTLDNWGKKYPLFFGALIKITQEQKKRLVDNGLSGLYNSTIAKLILSSNHGMAEKTELTGKDGESLFNPKSREKINDYLNESETRDTENS
jgi:hypothetical protein